MEHLRADGNWLQVLRPRSGGPRPALFLDRDGVVVEQVQFLHRPQDVRLVPGAAGVVARAAAAGWPVVLVTNQSGIGRARFGWRHFADVQEEIVRLLAERGAGVDLVAACPFHPAAEPPWRHPDHPWRKPRPGMLRAAAEALPIDLARSWIVGDKASDLAAGRAAGLANGALVATGYGIGQRDEAAALRTASFAVHFWDSVADAICGIPGLQE